MPRIRSIKPRFFTNEQLCVLPPLTRLLFAGLWTLADKAGRLEDRPKRIKAELFPYDDCDVDAMLIALESAGFILRYEAKGLRLIAIPTWNEHQRPHHKEPESTLPAPRLGRGKKGHASVMHEPSMTPEESIDPLDLDLDLDLVSGSGNRSGSGDGGGVPPARALTVVNPHSKPTNLVNGSEQRQHGQHAWCSWPHRDGLCVLAFLHREFIGKLGGIPSADMELRAWYPSVLAKYEGVPVGDDAIDFWRNEFREWVGVVTRKAHSGRESATEQTLRAGREYLSGVAGRIDR